MSEQANDVRAKVLIAEDDAIVALDLQGMVMRLGYDVVAIVDSGQAAVAAVRRFLPDIILLDVVLNGPMDGIDVAREIHKSIDIPVIFCVSSPDLSSLVRAKEISYAGYLLKPINPDSLSTTLDTVLYKFKLEKRVQKAEEKFRNLAAKYGILQFFFEEKAAFEWNWNAETGINLISAVEGDELPECVKASSSRLGSSVAAWNGNFDGKNPRLSLLLEVDGPSGGKCLHAVIGVKNQTDGSISGMMIPLSRDDTVCPPR